MSASVTTLLGCATPKQPLHKSSQGRYMGPAYRYAHWEATEGSSHTAPAVIAVCIQ